MSYVPMFFCCLTFLQESNIFSPENTDPVYIFICKILVSYLIYVIAHFFICCGYSTKVNYKIIFNFKI